MSKEEIEEAKRLFAKIDTDNSGFITVDELVAYLTNEKKDANYIQGAKEIVNVFDKNNDGKLSIQEFIAFMEAS